jgi:hypothetical protein
LESLFLSLGFDDAEAELMDELATAKAGFQP